MIISLFPTPPGHFQLTLASQELAVLINITDTPETSMHFQNTPTALGRLLTSGKLEEH